MAFYSIALESQLAAMALILTLISRTAVSLPHLPEQLSPLISFHSCSVQLGIISQGNQLSHFSSKGNITSPRNQVEVMWTKTSRSLLMWKLWASWHIVWNSQEWSQAKAVCSPRLRKHIAKLSLLTKISLLTYWGERNYVNTPFFAHDYAESIISNVPSFHIPKQLKVLFLSERFWKLWSDLHQWGIIWKSTESWCWWGCSLRGSKTNTGFHLPLY